MFLVRAVRRAPFCALLTLATLTWATTVQAFETAEHFVASSADPASRIYVNEKRAPGVAPGSRSLGNL